MSDSDKQLGSVLDRISMLYELSLNAGSSLDLQENCRTFFEAMMSRCNFGFIALYLRTSESESIPMAEKELHGVYASPQSLSPLPHLSVSHPGLQEIVSEGAISQTLNDSDFADIIAVAPLTSSLHGCLTAFALDDLGVLFCIDQTRETAMAAWDINPFRLLLKNFRHSIAACLAHEHLAKETATRIELQQRVAQMEKMESLGVLAGGVAHDLNNILTPLALLPTAIRWDLKLPAESPVHEDLDAIETAALQAAEMISDLLAMARSGGGRTEPVQLEQTVDAFLKTAAFRRACEQSPAIKTEVQLAKTGTVEAGESAIGRMLLNLVTNAFEAMNGSGQVQIRTRELTLGEAHNGYEVIPPGDYCLLEVSDTGSGIPEAVIARVFEPFYSSKKMGSSGSGLGLAVVYGLVKDFAGHVDISTSPAGTCFHLYFPRKEG